MKLGCCCFPQRYIVVFMSFLGVTIFYVIRTSLRITLRKMASEYDQSSKDKYFFLIQQGKCSEELHKYSNQEQQNILVTFYYGYAICHIPGAVLIKRYGAKVMFGLGALMSSILALLLPLAACYSKYTLIAARTSMGIAMSVFFSSLADLLARWSPTGERTLLSAIVFAGSQVGMMNTWMLPWFLLDAIKWQYMYISLGAIGIIWCLLWSKMVYNTPDEHPYIKPQELEFMQKYVQYNDTMPTPWMAILKSKAVWSLAIANFGHGYGFYTIIVNLPRYYHDVSKISYAQNGDLAVLSFLLMWLASVLLGFLCDKIIMLKWTSRTQLRRTLAAIGAVGPGIGMVWASYQSNEIGQIALITMFMSSMSFCYCSLRVNPLDLTRNHAALVMALANGVSSLAGIIAPAVVNTILSGTNKNSFIDRQRQWQNIFWIMFTVLVISSIPFLLYGSGQIQTWDTPEKAPSGEEQPTIATSEGKLTVMSTNIIL